MQILGPKGLSTYKAVQAAHMYFDTVLLLLSQIKIINIIIS